MRPTPALLAVSVCLAVWFAGCANFEGTTYTDLRIERQPVTLPGFENGSALHLRVRADWSDEVVSNRTFVWKPSSRGGAQKAAGAVSSGTYNVDATVIPCRAQSCKPDKPARKVAHCSESIEIPRYQDTGLLTVNVAQDGTAPTCQIELSSGDGDS
jgi:hypothetical protein